MKLDLRQSRTGHSIVGGLRVLCEESGGSMEHVPVSISHAGHPEDEVRLYTGISVDLGSNRIHILGPDGETRLLREREYDSILLEGDQAETLKRLEDSIDEFESRCKRGPSSPSHEDEQYSPERRDLSQGMRVLVVIQGEYGERILDWLKRASPPDWKIEKMRIPSQLPEMIDDPSNFVPDDFLPSDLVVFLSEEGNAPQLATDVVRASGAQAIIAPVDRTEWMPSGQITQLKRSFMRWGVDTSFPRPFCALEPTGADAIDRFARLFGIPDVEILTDDGRTVSEMRVRRGSPCGCTHYVAENLVGEPLEEAVERAGLLHHHFPCLASMEREPDLDDTLMHVSCLILKRVVEDEVRKHVKRKINYLDPEQFKR
jgi:hypothetical protein